MDVKEAVKRAREFLLEVFEDEVVGQVRLEEAGYDSTMNAWQITFSMTRPSVPTTPGVLAAAVGSRVMKASYKTVTVPEDAFKLPSVKIREIAE